VRRRFRTLARRPREVHLTVELLDDADAAAPSAADIKAALDDMPPRQRSALVLRELGGLPYAEIATRLDVSVPAVETLLFRARAGFRERLERTRAIAVTGLPTALLGRLSGWLGSVSEPSVVGRVVGVVGALAIGTGIALETGALPRADAASGPPKPRPFVVAPSYDTMSLSRSERSSRPRVSVHSAKATAASSGKKTAASPGKKHQAAHSTPTASSGTASAATAAASGDATGSSGAGGLPVPSTGSIVPSAVSDAASQVPAPDPSDVTDTVVDTAGDTVSDVTSGVPSLP
jgi:hypothetical protein